MPLPFSLFGSFSQFSANLNSNAPTITINIILLISIETTIIIFFLFSILIRYPLFFHLIKLAKFFSTLIIISLCLMSDKASISHLLIIKLIFLRLSQLHHYFLNVHFRLMYHNLIIIG